MENIKHICCSTDGNYLQHCVAMLSSLLENTTSEFTIHILCTPEKLKPESRLILSNLISKYKSKCVFQDIDETLLDGVKFRKNRPLTYAAYYRILLASLLDESIETIFYLDCDIIVLRDIASIFTLNIEGYALAAVQDMTNPCDLQRMQLSIPYDECFFCSGVMLINLKYWREHHSEVKLLEYSKKERNVFLHDQDALNAVFYNKWFRLPPKWNRFNMQIPSSLKFLSESDRLEFIQNPMLIHYLIKPWFGLKGVRYTKEYMFYLEKANYQFEYSEFVGKGIGLYCQIFVTDLCIFSEEHNCKWLFGFVNGLYSFAILLRKILLYPLRLIKR